MSSSSCPHGARKERSGISKRTARPYRGLFCPANVCPPEWLDAFASPGGFRPDPDAKLVAENIELRVQLEAERVQAERWRKLANAAMAECKAGGKPANPVGAIYSERVGKLINLAVGASTDAEAQTAFEKARAVYLRERAS